MLNLLLIMLFVITPFVIADAKRPCGVHWVESEVPLYRECSCQDYTHYWVIDYDQAHKLFCAPDLWFREDLGVCDFPCNHPSQKN